MRPTQSIALSLLAAMPLAALALWVYLPARPYAYFDLTTLILEEYRGPGQALTQAGLELRRLCLFALGALCCGLLARTALRWPQCVLAGVSASLLPLLPVAVPWVVSAEVSWQLLWGGAAVALLVALQQLARSLPATVWPLIVACLLLGPLFAVRSATQVTLLGNPPLKVLHDVGRYPESPVANLAMGFHMLSLGGRDVSIEYFDRAGRLVLERSEDFDPAVLEAARGLRELQRAAGRDQL